MDREKLQLENAGDAATITVQYVNEVATKFGTKLVFVGTDNTETPLIPDTTADKQLARLQLDRASAVGETLTFSRAANPSGKPYWNIDVFTLAKPASKRIPPPEKKQPFDEDPYANPGPIHPARVPAAPDYPPSWDDVPMPDDPNGELAAKHPTAPSTKGVAPNAAKRVAITTDYLALLAYVKQHGPLQDESAIQSAAATIFIQWKNAGLV
jgi:hypothetical protein